MRKLAFVILLMSQWAFGTAAVSGKLTLPDGTGVSAGSFAQLDLKNCGGNFPQVSGASITNRKTFNLATDGTWSGTLYRDDEISCNGGFSTWWTLSYWVKQAQTGPSRDFICSQSSCVFDGTGGLTPITVYPSPIPPAQPLTGAESVVCSFPVAASTWTCTENMGTQQVVAEFFDLSSNQIFPDNAQATDVNTFVATWLNPQTGFVRVVNVGNWTPSVSAPNNIISNPVSDQAIVGNHALTLGGNLSVQGSVVSNTPFTGTINVCRLETMRYVDTANTCAWTGLEAGAWINTAAADCPSTGCTILVAAGTYSYSTPIVISKGGVKLKGMGKSATQLNFTSTGIGIKVDAGADSIEDLSLDGSAGPASACLSLVDDGGSAVANGSFANLKLNGCTRDLDLVSTGPSVIWNNFANIEMRNGGTNGLRLKATTPGFVNENVFINNLIRTAANTGTDALLDGSAGQVAINTFINNDAANQNGAGGIGYSLLSATENFWYGGDFEQDTKGINIDATSTGNKVFGAETSGCAPCFVDSTPVGNSNTGMFLTPLGNSFNSILLQATNPSAGARIRWLDAGNAEVDQFVQNNQVRFVNGANQWNFTMNTGQTSQNGPATPTAAGGTTLGTTALPWSGVYVGAAATNNALLTGTFTAARTHTLQDSTGTIPLIIASGTSTLGSSSISAATCNSVVTTAATNAVTSDTISWSYASAVNTTTDGKLVLSPYLTAGNVNWVLCNPTAGALTPTGLVVNWRVIR